MLTCLTPTLGHLAGTIVSMHIPTASGTSTTCTAVLMLSSLTCVVGLLSQLAWACSCDETCLRARMALSHERFFTR